MECLEEVRTLNEKVREKFAPILDKVDTVMAGTRSRRERNLDALEVDYEAKQLATAR